VVYGPNLIFGRRAQPRVARGAQGSRRIKVVLPGNPTRANSA
jgi:hypothetical protein